LHRGHSSLGRGIPRRRENGTAPRRKAFYDLMGPPINHGAFRPARAPQPSWPMTRMMLFSGDPAQIAPKN
jgi:hypothetical protein